MKATISRILHEYMMSLKSLSECIVYIEHGYDGLKSLIINVGLLCGFLEWYGALTFCLLYCNGSVDWLCCFLLYEAIYSSLSCARLRRELASFGAVQLSAANCNC